METPTNASPGLCRASCDGSRLQSKRAQDLKVESVTAIAQSEYWARSPHSWDDCTRQRGERRDSYSRSTRI